MFDHHMVVWHTPRLWETRCNSLFLNKQSRTFFLISHILGRRIPAIIWPCRYLLSYSILKTKLIFFNRKNFVIFILLATLYTCDYLLAHKLTDWKQTRLICIAIGIIMRLNVESGNLHATREMTFSIWKY